MSRNLSPRGWGVIGLCEAPQAFCFLQLFPEHPSDHPSAQMKPGHFTSLSKARSFHHSLSVGWVSSPWLVVCLCPEPQTQSPATKDPSSPGAAKGFCFPTLSRRETHPVFPLPSHASSRSFRFPCICLWVGPSQRRAAACVGRGRFRGPPASFAVPRRCSRPKLELLQTAAGLRVRAGRSVT